MKRWAFILLVPFFACSDDDPVDPGPPALGGRVLDRMGRPAVNTALNNVLSQSSVKGIEQDAYNSSTPESWPTFTATIGANLAIFDSLDTVCGNQVLAGGEAVAGRYDTLAGALADDRLYVNSDSGACGQYLAVELNATMVIPNNDCGGRAPSYDVIDTTYSALAIGAPSGVGDGVDSDDDVHSDTEFPFLAAP